MAKVIRGAKIVPAEIVDAETRAAVIVEAAHREAETLRASLRAELAAEARAAARAELAAAMVRVEASRGAALAEVRAQAAALAGAVARRVVADALAIDPMIVRALVEEASARVARASRVVLHVHPDDAPLLDGLPGERVSDATLARGDCVVESELGDVDGRVETKIDRLLAALGGVIG